MKLYKTKNTILVEKNAHFYDLGILQWDSLINRDDLYTYLNNQVVHLHSTKVFLEDSNQLLAPIGTQEVWAAGVTYLRSREARMKEAEKGGAADFYDAVYEAERPELFFKANPNRVVGHTDQVKIRKDSNWNVPEPELTLFINRNQKITGYTIGNDMSSRSIEGENPLYLPQAKIYDASTSLGPGLLVLEYPISKETIIQMQIVREKQTIYKDEVSINRMKRSHEELAAFLFRECSFPNGVFLMTGTCLVPPDTFTLMRGDEIIIRIPPIGTLVNFVQ